MRGARDLARAKIFFGITDHDGDQLLIAMMLMDITMVVIMMMTMMIIIMMRAREHSWGACARERFFRDHES